MQQLDLVKSVGFQSWGTEGGQRRLRELTISTGNSHSKNQWYKLTHTPSAKKGTDEDA